MSPPPLASVSPLCEATAVKTAANAHEIETLDERLTRIEARQSEHTLLLLDIATGVEELLRRVP